MNSKIITVSILGCGWRGGETYGKYMHSLKDKYKITDICEIDINRLKQYGDEFDISATHRFTDEDEFFREKRSDLIIISTQDKDHYRHAMKSIELGYDILLEKPISNDLSELCNLAKAIEKTKVKIMVCHVLRYTPMMRKLKELLDNGRIGQLISIDHIENVMFWHMAHSYVRGNWNNSDKTTPMIMAKCCHDLDLLQWFAGSQCDTISSIGDLRFFKKENTPAGASDRCSNCVLKETCKYSAYKIYLDKWINAGCPENAYPWNTITMDRPITYESIVNAIENSRYGQCVFACDNNVVDNQTCIMSFMNGVTATLRMEAFTKYGGRKIRFFGTEGELELDEKEGIITLRRYHEEDETWDIRKGFDNHGHGGGDTIMIDELYEALISENKRIETDFFKSIESHNMAREAEESRLRGGELIYV